MIKIRQPYVENAELQKDKARLGIVVHMLKYVMNKYELRTFLQQQMGRIGVPAVRRETSESELSHYRTALQNAIARNVEHENPYLQRLASLLNAVLKSPYFEFIVYKTETAFREPVVLPDTLKNIRSEESAVTYANLKNALKKKTEALEKLERDTLERPGGSQDTLILILQRVRDEYSRWESALNAFEKEVDSLVGGLAGVIPSAPSIASQSDTVRDPTHFDLVQSVITSNNDEWFLQLSRQSEELLRRFDVDGSPISLSFTYDGTVPLGKIDESKMSPIDTERQKRVGALYDHIHAGKILVASQLQAVDLDNKLTPDQKMVLKIFLQNRVEAIFRIQIGFFDKMRLLDLLRFATNEEMLLDEPRQRTTIRSLFETYITKHVALMKSPGNVELEKTLKEFVDKFFIPFVLQLSEPRAKKLHKDLSDFVHRFVPS